MADSNSGNRRLVEVDALRGLAALAVVLFHYTTRFTELFAPNPPPTFSFPDGHYGVNLFFIISGFVIFMTLEKTVKADGFRRLAFQPPVSRLLGGNHPYLLHNSLAWFARKTG